MIEHTEFHNRFILMAIVFILLNIIIAACSPVSAPTIAVLAETPIVGKSNDGVRLPNTWTPAPTRKFEQSPQIVMTSTPRPSRTLWPTGTTTEIIPTSTPSNTPSPTLTCTPIVRLNEAVTVTPTPFSPISMLNDNPANLQAIGEDLQANGLALAYSKIGFHVSIGGDKEGLSEWMEQLDEAGIPFFLKSVDYAGPIFEAQQLVKASGVPHTLVYRSSADLPDYNLPPEEAAREHWDKHMALFPPELDRRTVWLETVNEVDKGRSDWLARFSIATAQLSLADGFRWAAFGWSTGEPESYDWETPAMLFFLRMVGLHLDRLAIAVHEYSGTTLDISFEYPDRIGRFMQLYKVCDRNDIPRPTILITEWGWTYNRVPSVNRSLEDIEWAARLYAPFPQVKGAAIWHLGGGESFGNIADPAQRLIKPITDFSLRHYFVVPPFWVKASLDPALYYP